MPTVKIQDLCYRWTRIPLKGVLTLPFLLQLLGAVSLVGYLSWRNGQQAICDLADSLMWEVSNRIEAELADQVGQANEINRLNAEAIALGMLDLNDPINLSRYFLGQMKTFPGLTAVYWSTEAGEYIGAEYRPDATYALGFTNPTTQGKLEVYSINRQGQPDELLHANPYDPRQRPWYQLAVNEGQATWTDIFVWSPMVIMSIDRVQPVYDEGRLQGVLGISLGLLDISQFLKQLDFSPSGQVFIIEPRTGKIVANSTKINPYQIGADGVSADRLPIETEKLPWLRASSQFLHTQVDDLQNLEGNQQFHFWLDGKRYFLQTTSLRNTIGLDWVMLVVVPEANFMAQINANTRTTLALSLGALIVAIVSGLLTARWIARPIDELNQAAKALSHDHRHQPPTACSPVKEVQELSTSFGLMAQKLQQSFSGLEQKVNERTTELAQANQQLATAKEKAEAANKTKSRFIANVSHELRTPLNAILGFTQLLQRSTETTPNQQSHLGIISRSSEHLLSLINNVLAMSKIEAGHITLVETSIDIHVLLQTLEEIFRLKVTEKELSFQVERSPQLPRYLQVDAGKLRQILMNLLSNALKFTHQGGIILRAKLCPPGKSKGALTKIPHPETIWLRFEVEDSGPGIAPEHRAKLFEPFIQAETNHTSQDGTGLGLAICRDYTQLMGGHIDVHQAHSGGALFRVDLPLRQAAGSQDKVEQQRVIGLAPHQPTYRILVVDDQPTIQRILQVLLDEIGLQVRVSDNGADGVAEFQRWQPHLIWMDMAMPVMDGYEATRRIRQLEKNHCTGETPTQKHGMAQTSTKIIALTASAFEEDQPQILAAGCDDCVHKPFQEQAIFATLAKHLDLHYQYKEIPTGSFSGQTPSSLSLEVMSGAWQKELHQAATQADRDWLLRLISQIPTAHASLAERLTKLVEQFDFDTLVELAETQTLV